ncbi:MAG: hypothetical protein ACJ762_16205 [Solirubrobacteraceae bacterium]
MALEQRIEWLEQRPGQALPVATGSLACPDCDAPIMLAPGRHGPSAPVACTWCGRDGAVRDFLSLAQPTRPARVIITARLG